MTTAVQGVIDGLLMGGIYAVIAVGLTLLLGVVRIVNFAHGAFVMAAGYCAFLLYTELNVDPYLGLLILVPTFFAVGVLYYVMFLKRLVGVSLLGQSLFTIGIAFILINGALGLFGPDVKTVQLSYGLSTLHVGAFNLVTTRLAAFGVGLLSTGLLYLLLWRTDYGVQVRASASDPRTAELMGIRTVAVQAVATGLSIACAAIGGVVLFPILYVSPGTGDQFTFLAFIIIVLGGLGNFWGALAGGLLIGITQTLGATYFDGSLAEMLTFALFVVLLIVRPNGLLARKAA